MRLEFDQRSVRQLRVNLTALPQKVTRLQLIKGLNAAGGPAKTTANAKAARETGLLAKSMTVKVLRDKRTKDPYGVVIGASRKVKRFVRMTSKGLRTVGDKTAKKLGITQLRQPARYVHLAERKSPAIAAAQRTLETTGLARLHQKLTEGIAQEASKLPK